MSVTHQDVAERSPLETYRAASVCKQLGDHLRAEQLFRSVMQDRELAGGALFHLGEIAYLAHDYVRAQEHFRRCLIETPSHQKAKSYLASLGVAVAEPPAVASGVGDPNVCRVCAGVSPFLQGAYGRQWHRCDSCGFLQAEISAAGAKRLLSGEGFRAGTGVGGGGYREYWIAEFLRTRLSLPRTLLYGTGNTPTFERLVGEGADVCGCDISNDLVAFRQTTHGSRFFEAAGPWPGPFDSIVAVEVFEHLLDPMTTFQTMFESLSDDGVIAGTTDFYQGGDISNHIYLQSAFHIAYWSQQSLTAAASAFGRHVTLFELERPGSVYPDEKFGLLWPRKRVFFIHPEKHIDFFLCLQKSRPILPIDKP
jgi:hypothetical protein